MIYFVLSLIALSLQVYILTGEKTRTLLLNKRMELLCPGRRVTIPSLIRRSTLALLFPILAQVLNFVFWLGYQKKQNIDVIATTSLYEYLPKTKMNLIVFDCGSI